MVTSPNPAPVAATPGVPTVSTSVVIDWGSWLAQIFHQSETVIGATVGAVEGALLSTLPFGSIVSAFIGPQVIAGYVTAALHNLEGLIEGQTLTSHGVVEQYVFNALNAFEPALVHMIGDELIPMVQGIIAKMLPGAKV